jgi:tetratricopeptide (TPR) repeat protein
MNKLKGSSLPTNIVDVVLNRIEDITGDEQRVLSYASVLGSEIEFELLLELTGMSEDIVLCGIEEGIKERFLVKDLTSVERIYFAHDRIRDAFYTRVPQEKKIPLHKHVGETLERKHSDNIDHVLYDIAHHFTLAQVEEKTLYYSLQAGKKAQAGYAHDQAIKLYEKAREILERRKKTKTDEYLDLLVRLGTEYKASSRYDESLGALNTCESLIPDKDVIRKAEVLSIIGDTLLEKGEKEKVVEVLLQALKLLGVKLPQNIVAVFSGISIESTIWTFHRLFPGIFVRKEYKHDPKTAVILHILNRLNYFYYFVDMNKCLHCMYKTLNMADRMGPSRELAHILSTWTVGWSGIPWPGRAKKDGLRAVKVGQDLNDRAAEGRALAYFADSALNNRSAEECYDLAVKSVELLKGVGEYWDLGVGMAHVAAGAMIIGKNIEDVLKETEEMIKIAESANSIQGWGWLLYHKTHALAIIGDERLKTEGIKGAEQSILLQQKALDKPSELWATAILAFAHLRARNWDEAIRTAEQVKKLIPTHNNMAGWIWDLHNICAQVYLESAQHKPDLSEEEKKDYLKKAKHSCRRARIRAIGEEGESCQDMGERDCLCARAYEGHLPLSHAPPGRGIISPERQP